LPRRGLLLSQAKIDSGIAHLPRFPFPNSSPTSSSCSPFPRQCPRFVSLFTPDLTPDVCPQLSLLRCFHTPR
jgi:hypothetical protein